MNSSIYLMRPDPEGYRWLTLKNGKGTDLIELVHEARSLSPIQEGLEAEEIIENDEDRKKIVGDFPCFWNVPTVSKRAMNLLKVFLEGNAELIPVNNGQFYVVNVLNILDCLDEEKSVLSRYKSSGRIREIIEYTFIEEMTKNQNLFRIQGFSRVDIYVGSDFKELVEREKLKGFEFEKVWPN